MKLLTKEIIKKLNKNAFIDESLDSIMDKKPVAKLFNPTGIGRWWLWSIQDGVFLGIAELQEREMGYFTLDELESFKGTLGIPIERDKYYSADKTFNELLNGEK
jgi:hypothetical protein